MPCTFHVAGDGKNGAHEVWPNPGNSCCSVAQDDKLSSCQHRCCQPPQYPGASPEALTSCESKASFRRDTAQVPGTLVNKHGNQGAVPARKLPGCKYSGLQEKVTVPTAQAGQRHMWKSIGEPGQYRRAQGVLQLVAPAHSRW